MYKKLLSYTISGILFTAIVGTLSHFVYEWSGNHWLAGLFTPVNESTWEHMKLLFFPMALYGMFALPRLEGEYPCSPYGYWMGILAGTLAIPVLFYTYSGIWGKHHIVGDVLVFYLSVILGFCIFYCLSRRCSAKNPVFPGLLVLLLAACFLLFTIMPPEFGIFISPV